MFHVPHILLLVVVNFSTSKLSLEDYNWIERQCIHAHTTLQVKVITRVRHSVIPHKKQLKHMCLLHATVKLKLSDTVRQFFKFCRRPVLLNEATTFFAMLNNFCELFIV